MSSLFIPTYFICLQSVIFLVNYKYITQIPTMYELSSLALKYLYIYFLIIYLYKNFRIFIQINNIILKKKN